MTALAQDALEMAAAEAHAAAEGGPGGSEPGRRQRVGVLENLSSL